METYLVFAYIHGVVRVAVCVYVCACAGAGGHAASYMYPCMFVFTVTAAIRERIRYLMMGRPKQGTAWRALFIELPKLSKWNGECEMNNQITRLLDGSVLLQGQGFSFQRMVPSCFTAIYLIKRFSISSRYSQLISVLFFISIKFELGLESVMGPGRLIA